MAHAHSLTPVVAAAAQASFTDAFFLPVCSTDRNKSQDANSREKPSGGSGRGSAGRGEHLEKEHFGGNRLND